MNTLPTTHQRLLDAAARVFAQRGIEGASTREIARDAGVNEVTLFRKFRNKEGLVSSVVENMFSGEAEKPLPETADLRKDLLKYAATYSEMIARNLPLIRTMIGEIHRFQDHERRVFHSVFRPFRQRLAERLKKEAATVRRGSKFSCEMLADQLNGMIFMDVLRRSSPFLPMEYPAKTYYVACVDLLLASLAKKLT